LARRYGGTAAQQIGGDAARRYGVAAAVLHSGTVASQHQPPSEKDLEAATGAGGEMEVPEVVVALGGTARLPAQCQPRHEEHQQLDIFTVRPQAFLF
jgi:hypothetical protein